ncbi:hypothetical protein [Litorimonas taeanensis]|nr:hypothetical protein [Litorimonas taeanensis]
MHTVSGKETAPRACPLYRISLIGSAPDGVRQGAHGRVNEAPKPTGFG